MRTKYIIKSFTFEGKRHFVKGRTEKEAIEKAALKKRDLEVYRPPKVRPKI